MRYFFGVAATILLIASSLNAWAQDGQAKALELAPPSPESLAGFTLVDWQNGIIFELDPRIRVAVQPHCNLLGGFKLAWPEPDTDCDSAAQFEPVYELEVSASHAYFAAIAAGAGAEDDGLVGAVEVKTQARLDELQAAQMRGQGRTAAGTVQTMMADGSMLEVPYYDWHAEAADGLGWCLEFAVLQPDARQGPQVITLALRTIEEPSPVLLEMVASRLRLFDATKI